jgi:hypothetical protein
MCSLHSSGILDGCRKRKVWDVQHYKSQTPSMGSGSDTTSSADSSRNYAKKLPVCVQSSICPHYPSHRHFQFAEAFSLVKEIECSKESRPDILSDLVCYVGKSLFYSSLFIFFFVQTCRMLMFCRQPGLFLLFLELFVKMEIV